MRTVVVYRAKMNRPTGGRGRGEVFLVWKLVADHGIGFEEIHYTDLDSGPYQPDGDYTEDDRPQFVVPAAASLPDYSGVVG